MVRPVSTENMKSRSIVGCMSQKVGSSDEPALGVVVVVVVVTAD